MIKKKSFVLRLNSEMYDALEQWAEDEFRSTNGQLEWIISDALKKAGRKPKRRESENVENVKSVKNVKNVEDVEDVTDLP